MKTPFCLPVACVCWGTWASPQRHPHRPGKLGTVKICHRQIGFVVARPSGLSPCLEKLGSGTADPHTQSLAPAQSLKGELSFRGAGPGLHMGTKTAEGYALEAACKLIPLGTAPGTLIKWSVKC